MKIPISNYIFDASAQTITFSDYVSIDLNSVLLIVNETDNDHPVIYSFSPTFTDNVDRSGTVATNVLTLAYDTTAMNDSDKLLIFYQDETAEQKISVASLPLPLTAATSTKQIDGSQKSQIVDGSGNVIGSTSNALDINIKSGNPAAITGFLTESNFDTKVGGLTESAPATDTASSGLNGRLQRIAQRITAFIGLIPAALTGSGNFKTAIQEAIPAGSDRIGKITVRNSADGADIDPLSESDFDNKIGSLTEAAPGTDTASSGLNGRLQRIAQRITSLISTLGSPFQSGGSIGNTSFASTVADGANVTEGAIADAIVAAGAAGSISAKLRRLTQGLEDLKTLIVLGAGSAAIGKLAANSGIDIGDVTLNNTTSEPVPIGGTVASDGVDSGNPIKIGGIARSSLITAVANADRVDQTYDTYGRQIVTHIDPAQQIWKEVEASSAQTGVAIWTPAGGKKVAITSLHITTGGTTAGVVTVWFGASGDTTFSQGVDQVVFRGEFAPSTTSRPFSIMTPPVPFFGATTDHVLRYTTVGAITIYITVYGYEFT